MADILGFLGQMGATVINNEYAKQRTQHDREANYYLNEQAAKQADIRTRSLYNDFYSPEALMRQYKAAGLSPSLMFGGTPGQGGTAGAQGAGTAGPQTPVYGVDPLVGAQIANIMAETNKTKAETANITTDTQIKELERQMQEMTTGQFKTEWEILNTPFETEDGNGATSLFEMAREAYTYEAFIEDIRTNSNGSKNTALYNQTTTEAGQKILRTIFNAANIFHRDIMVLSQESISAQFQTEVIQELQKMDYAKTNAGAAIQQLKELKATAELTETQKEAWNNLIDKLSKKGSTTRDIVVVLGMILSNFASHTGIKVNIGN